MKTIEINLYKFSELSEEVKKKAIEKLCDINVDYDWWDSTYDDAENVGLKLTGFDTGRGSYCNGEFTDSACSVAEQIINNHGDTCETYKTAQKFMAEWQPIFNNYMDESHADYESSESEDKMTELEDDFLKSILDDYLTILRNEYDYLQSEEAIIETINANEYEFTEDGKLY